MDRLELKKKVIDEIIDHLDGMVAEEMMPTESPMGMASEETAPEMSEGPVVPDEEVDDMDPAMPEMGDEMEEGEELEDEEDEDDEYSFARGRMRG